MNALQVPKLVLKQNIKLFIQNIRLEVNFDTSIIIFVVYFIRQLFQMHHPIQMKPADSENRNGKFTNANLFV